MNTVDYKSRMPLGSRGNQAKFQIGNKIVKIDTYADGKRICTEGLYEVLCSRLIQSGSCHVAHVDYDFCKIQVNDMILSGCISDNFIPAGASEYTLQEIYNKYNKKRKLAWELSKKWPYQSPEKAVNAVIRDLQKAGVTSASSYIHRLLFFDTVFRNTDRHANNYSFLQMPDHTIEPAPLFDFGMAFGANTHALFEPPKLFFPSGQDVMHFLYQECDRHEWNMWGVPDYLLFSQTDFDSFIAEAALYYTANELELIKYSLCEAVLDFPDIFPNLDAIQISKL